jgi:hypothetical protein
MEYNFVYEEKYNKYKKKYLLLKNNHLSRMKQLEGGGKA